MQASKAPITLAVELALFTNQYFTKPNSAEDTAFKQLATALGLSYLRVDKISEGLFPHLFNVSEGYDYLMIGHEDSEFYNLSENKKLLEKVLKYDVDIGFGDHYPEGMISEVVRREAMPVLENIRSQNNIAEDRKCLEKTIAVDVNTFDLENHYAEVNLRTLRIATFSDNLQDQVTINTIKNFFPEQSVRYFLNLDYVNFAETLLKNRHLLRTIPKYYELAITHRQPQEYRYAPFISVKPGEKNDSTVDIAPEDFTVVIDKLKNFSHDPVIALNGIGETTAHREWRRCVEIVLEHDLECIVETSGIFWTKEVSEYWLNHPKKDLLSVVFKIEAIDAELYRSIRGNSFDLSTVMDNIEYYLLRNPDKTYVETVKTTETFKHLPEFHRYYSEYTKNIIIGKYNPYRGTLPELRIKPMMPYEQIDCWHLKRELKIDPHGDIWICKQDVQKEHVLGNILTESVEAIHARGQEYFKKHVAGWEFCKNCDEFYTYNF